MLTDLINDCYDSLNSTDIYVLKEILALKVNIDKIGIEELAKQCNTSKSTIMRLTKKIGFSGYSEFKNYIKWEKNTSKNDFKGDLLAPIKSDFEETLKQLEETNQMQELVKEIYRCNNIILFGTGVGQRYCAMELQRLFMQVNKHMYLIDGVEEFLLSSKGLGKNDLVIIFSLSGNANLIENALHILKLNCTKIASITNRQKNKLSSLSDYRLYITSSPLEIENGLIHNSFINFFVVVEFLFREYFKYQREVEEVETF